MNKKIAASAAALVALGVASGTAFTNSLTGVSPKTAGFSTTTVTGATLSNIDFDYDATGEDLTVVSLAFSSDPAIEGDDVVVNILGAGDAVLKTLSGQTVDASLYTASFSVTAGEVKTSDITGYSISVVDSDEPVV